MIFGCFTALASSDFNSFQFLSLTCPRYRLAPVFWFRNRFWGRRAVLQKLDGIGNDVVLRPVEITTASQSCEKIECPAR